MKKKIKNLNKMFKMEGYIRWFILLFIIILGTQTFEIITIPMIVTKIFDYNIPEKNILGLIIMCTLYSIIMFISCYLTLKHVLIRCWLQRWIQKDLRNKVFEKLQYIKKDFYDKNTTGVILQFLNDDSYNASQLFSKICTEMLVMGIGRFTIILIFLLFVNVRITLLILLVYFVGAILTIYFNRSTLTLISEIRKINIELYTYTAESINNFVTIKTLNIIKHKEEELQIKLNEYNKKSMQIRKKVSLYKSIFSIIISLADILIVVYGGINVIQGIFTYAQLVLFMEYSGELSHEFDWFISNISLFNKSYIAFSKIIEFLENNNIENINKGKTLAKLEKVELNNVCFEYKDSRNILSGINLEISKNKSIAIVGKTGAGKSTIVNIICRLYEPTSGEVLINNNNYLKYSIKSIRNKIGYILQEIDILPNTILDNIKFVRKDITINQVEDIFKRLGMHEKIVALKYGYNTDIYNNPDLLSQGEKQLINFARIMALDAELVIMDEITSYLSSENEKMIRKAIKEVTRDKMSIIIAHRLPTIQQCDEILFLKEGKIVEHGTHEELINIKGEYYKLYNN